MMSVCSCLVTHLHSSLPDGIRSMGKHRECLPAFFCSVVVVISISLSSVTTGAADGVPFSRNSFPPDFIFGAASSSYQYEGAVVEGGRGPSIWDTYTSQHPERITDGSNGRVATDFYHRYKEDVGNMKNMGMDALRFSISWSRILPTGSLSGGINREGIKFYNNLINELLSKGLKPFVTLFHWDTPQGLEDLYGSFLSPRIVKDYVNYADICFKEFGDRVKHWITFNEPWSFCSEGYRTGNFAPGRCSPWAGNCSGGDSGREPYTVCHHQLLAHAAAVKLYREKYKGSQKGIIGITLVSHWFVPFDPKSKPDLDAAERALDFMYGWLVEPLTQGDYPFNMKVILGDRLPQFTEGQSKMVKGSFDFLGLNYYTTHYAIPIPFTGAHGKNKISSTDSFAYTSGSINGKAIGPVAATPILYIYPAGIKELLLYTKEKYGSPIIYITENGVDEADNASLSLGDALNDDVRVNYYRQHLQQVREAIREGVDVRGFFPWSLLDNFEWSSGYTVRFGIYYVDFRNGLKRYPKKSAHWFRSFLMPNN